MFLRTVLTDPPCSGDGFCYLRFRNCRRCQPSEDVFYISSPQSALNNETEVSAVSLERKVFFLKKLHSNKIQELEFSSHRSSIMCPVITLTTTVIHKVIAHISISQNAYNRFLGGLIFMAEYAGDIFSLKVTKDLNCLNISARY